LEWFEQHRLLTLYLLVCELWALWNLSRAVLRTRRLRLGYSLAFILLAPLILPLSLFARKGEPEWMGLRWKCPDCAWAMFTEECEECGAVGVPYDPVTGRVVEEERDP